MRGWFVMLLLIVGAPLSSAQVTQGKQAIVFVRAFTTPIGGLASTTSSVDVNDVVRFHVTAGTPGNKDSLCVVELGGATDEKGVRTLLNGAQRVWTVDVDLLGVEGDSFDVDVASRRYRMGGGGEVVREMDTRRRIRLVRGEPYYVDFFAQANPGTQVGCAAQNLLIELRIRPPIDRSTLEFRDDLLRYEGWLVHEGVDGGATTSHFAALGKHGERVRFRFEPLRQPLGPGAASSLNVVTEVSGSVQGRKRPDGDIDLVVRADELSIITEERGFKLGLPSGAGGEKKLTVQPGEVIRIELPHPTGRSVHRLPPEWGGQSGTSLPDVRLLGDANAVTVGDGVLVVDLAEWYRGLRTSLTLSVTPLE